MNKKTSKSKGVIWKIVALFLAICLWYFVIQIENPNDTYTISNIEIIVKNNDALLKRNLCLYEIENKKATVTLKGQKSLLGQFKNYKNQIKAIVDLKDYLSNDELEKKDGTYLPVQIVLPDILKNNFTVEKQNPSKVKAIIEEYIEDTKSISVNITSNLDDSYVYDASKIKLMPQKAQIKGAKSNVDKVENVVADLCINSSKNETYELELYAIDKDKKLIDNIEIVPYRLQVTLPLLMQKKVKLNANVLKKLGTDYELEELKIEPSEILIAVQEEKFLESDTTINIPINLEEVEGVHEIVKEIPMKEDFFNVNSVDKVKITYKVKSNKY